VSFPNIYILIETPVLGELGQNTVIRREKACQDCGKLEIFRDRVEYQFDRWNGQDLFTAYGLLFVTERLKNTLESERITGLVYHEAEATRASYFKFGAQAYSDSLPCIYWLELVARAKGPDSWWEKIRTCESCGGEKWWPSKEGIRSGGGPSTTGTKKDVENPLALRVYGSDWKGEDIFLLEPHHQPIVTENFAKIVNLTDSKQVCFRPTTWV
jgi:hypothetical protein